MEASGLAGVPVLAASFVPRQELTKPFAEVARTTSGLHETKIND